MRFLIGVFLVLGVLASSTISIDWLDQSYQTIKQTSWLQSIGNVASVAAGDSAVTSSSIVFVGDIMLAREVEQYMKWYGVDYPFANTTTLFQKANFVVANFEVAVPITHRPTPIHTFQFSVATSQLASLRTAGVTHLSLANNHALDYGLSGFLQTESALADHSLSTFGKPREFSPEQVSYLTTAAGKVALVGFDFTLSQPTAEELTTTLGIISDLSDLQIVYVHWGTEYQLVHTKSQQRYAELLIDAGADLIIGHHPHVVQDVGIYRDKLIFYSLGNFIFDQYFSREVQQGLVIQLDLTGEKAEIALLPVSTIESRNQPYLLTGFEKDEVLQSLAKRSNPALSDSIKQGKLILLNQLAATTQID